MGRTADYTIEGFMYQFQVSLNKVLLSTKDAVVNIEGIIEDIDIVTPTGIIAVQCKYHSTNKNFTLSAIYKPVLQMLVHFKNNSTQSISYKLFAHFPSQVTGSKKSITEEEIKSILSSTSKDLKKLIADLKGFSDFKKFISRFEIEFGPSYEENEKAIKLLLEHETGLSKEDIDQIYYPNSINTIAELSVLHDITKRNITKQTFIDNIKKSKKTIISRWTKELQSYELLLKKRKLQLRGNLNSNSRARCIILDGEYIKDFAIKSVHLIEDFINKYNFKIQLNEPPVFVLICTDSNFNYICEKLHDKNVDVERGQVAEKLNAIKFLRPPIKNIKQGKVEFRVRICKYEVEFDLILPHAKFDDLIIISDKKIQPAFSYNIINTEIIETPEINEIKYLLSINANL